MVVVALLSLSLSQLLLVGEADANVLDNTDLDDVRRFLACCFDDELATAMRRTLVGASRRCITN